MGLRSGQRAAARSPRDVGVLGGGGTSSKRRSSPGDVSEDGEDCTVDVGQYEHFASRLQLSTGLTDVDPD
jgi:hypothetical protein